MCYNFCMEDLISVAIIRKPQGVRGELRLSVFLDNESDFPKLKKLYLSNGDAFDVERVFKVGGDYAIKINGVSTFEEANKLKNQELFAMRSDIEKLKNPNDFFIADLLNKTARFENGEIVGVIDDVENYGASDIVFIKSKKYHNLSFANIGGIILGIDKEKQEVILDADKFKQVCVFDEQ